MLCHKSAFYGECRYAECRGAIEKAAVFNLNSFHQNEQIASHDFFCVIFYGNFDLKEN
jgi:hypothetical protein